MNEVTVATKDQLDELFTLQGDLQADMGHDFESMTLEERIEFIRWNAIALSGELAEALGEVGWKPWATARYIDREPYVGELIDMWKFLMNLGLVVAVTPNELMQRFRGKTLVNRTRHENGYDGVSSKCTTCHRALDEPHAS